MLRTAMGPAITAWLEDPAIVEVMLNPDGRLWIDRLAEGLADTGKRLSSRLWLQRVLLWLNRNAYLNRNAAHQQRE
jgi:Flp pilus assembly CpaF family ATPase